MKNLKKAQQLNKKLKKIYNKYIINNRMLKYELMATIKQCYI